MPKMAPNTDNAMGPVCPEAVGELESSGVPPRLTGDHVEETKAGIAVLVETVGIGDGFIVVAAASVGHGEGAKVKIGADVIVGPLVCKVVCIRVGVEVTAALGKLAHTQ